MPISRNERLLSLDLFRGLTMLLLLAEGTQLYYFFNVVVPENFFLHKFTIQFYHAEWHGMRFWDLIQPYFTFIVGVGMAFSLTKRWERGERWTDTFKHILFRCTVLFFLGIMLQSGYRGQLVWELWNILTQLSLSILITFFIFRFPYVTQLIISFFILISMELIYRHASIDGFDKPFVIDSNFGTYIDLALMGKTHPDGWVALNFIPTTAHMIWGVLTGKILQDKSLATKKIKILSVAFLIGLLAGYGLDWAGISPINKKISTSSFVLASGGWTLASFVFLYWLVDVKGYKRWVTFFAVLGMNPFFIYIFSRTVGRGFLNEFVPIFTTGFLNLFGVSEGIMNFTAYMVILGIEWYLCYWLYRKNIFIKL
jgi:predicted acyltransferase